MSEHLQRQLDSLADRTRAIEIETAEDRVRDEQLRRDMSDHFAREDEDRADQKRDREIIFKKLDDGQAARERMHGRMDELVQTVHDVAGDLRDLHHSVTQHPASALNAGHVAVMMSIAEKHKAKATFWQEASKKAADAAATGLGKALPRLLVYPIVLVMLALAVGWERALAATAKLIGFFGL